MTTTSRAAGGSEDRGVADRRRPRTSRGPVISQALRPGARGRGLRREYKDDLGPTEIDYPRSRTATSTSTASTRARCSRTSTGTPTGDADETNAGVAGQARPTRTTSSPPARRPRTTSTRSTSRQRPRSSTTSKTVSDLKAVAGELVFGGPPECEERALCLGDRVAAALRPAVQGGPEARHRRPDHVAALEDGDIQVGSAVHRAAA